MLKKTSQTSSLWFVFVAIASCQIKPLVIMDIGSSQGNASGGKVNDVVSHPCPGVTYFPLTISEKKPHPFCIACMAIRGEERDL